MIDKGICDKGFISNPSNCECECYKPCDVGEYWDYANFKSRKKLTDKLVEECTETIDEVWIAEMALFDRRNDCKSWCTIYVVFIVIVFTICIGIGAYFIYYKYINHNKKLFLNTIMSIKHY